MYDAYLRERLIATPPSGRKPQGRETGVQGDDGYSDTDARLYDEATSGADADLYRMHPEFYGEGFTPPPPPDTWQNKVGRAVGGATDFVGDWLKDSYGSPDALGRLIPNFVKGATDLATSPEAWQMAAETAPYFVPAVGEGLMGKGVLQGADAALENLWDGNWGEGLVNAAETGINAAGMGGTSHAMSKLLSRYAR